MPNPLSAVMTPPPAAAKPDANAAQPSDPKGAASFQMVMDQETDQQPGELDPAQPQVPEPEAESEEIVAEVEQAEISFAAEDQPPVDAGFVALQQTPQAPAEHRTAQAVLVHPASQKETETAKDTPPENPRADVSRAPENPVQRPAPAAAPPLAIGTAPPKGAREWIPAQNGLAAPAIAEMPPRDWPDSSVPGGSGRDAPHILPAPSPASQPPSPAHRAPTLVQMQLLATEKTTAQTEAPAGSDLADLQPVSETPVPSAARESGPAVQSQTATARAETARAVAGQMASVISARPQSGAVEIALNPEELGRVSIVVSGRDDGLHMTIAAERPETLDMMRRHLSVLETEFRNLGLGDLSLDLGTPSDAQQDDPDPDSSAPVSARQPEHIAAQGPALPQLGPDGRIDMRL